METSFKLIAEFCQNHNGDMAILREMIDAAAEGGATHGKIQTIFADDLSFRSEFELPADGGHHPIVRPYRAEYDRLKALEISYKNHAVFAETCRSAGIEPLTTAFTLNAVPQLVDIGFRSIKVASYDCGSLPLIQSLAENFEEIIVSTGASFDEEIVSTADFLNGMEVDFSLLHAVTIYPTPLNEMHLARLQFLKTLASSVGLSDHSLVARDGVKADLVAIHLGATVIERHFTVLPPDQTKDGPVSVDQNHLREIVRFVRMNHDEQSEFLSRHVPERDAMIGDSSRALSQTELDNRDYYRGRFWNKVGDEGIFNWDPRARELLGI